MARTKSLLQFIPLSLAVSLGVSVSTGFSTVVLAQQASQSTLISQQIRGNWNAFNPPNRGLPGGRQEGGGVRGPCPNGSEQLTALSPKTDAGITSLGQPSFYLYVPEGIALPMEFTISQYPDANNPQTEEKEVYKTTFNLTGKSGIISVTLPEKTAALEVGKSYYWSFALVCKPNAREASIIRGGWVQRQALSGSLEQEIQMAAKNTPEKLPGLFEREGMWYDAVAALAQLRSKNPGKDNIEKEWQALLNSVELGNLATAEFINYKASN
ncbi:DUF928 domain-containing protein [Ancylothrix sp. C2]|uniref:DUF928 domain-containing protein n=1 Tax=Ancylothrix sp. D3o TaxID=2953691 RepID=UPI0021BAD8C2|nr:DUF928 domain-containing protein [Ancylothrix sp. D3o]MCT7951499.1 DUF928 domain-containing protein [Ancylothrix sp. D3o]